MPVQPLEQVSWPIVIVLARYVLVFIPGAQ